MNFAVGTLLRDLLDFRQFTVEIQARIIQKISKIDFCFFLGLHSTLNFDLPRCLYSDSPLEVRKTTL